DNLLWMFHPNGSWSKVSLTTGSPIPPLRSEAAAVSDPSVGGFLWHGGEVYNGDLGVNLGYYDTWAFSNGSWRNLTAGTSPVPCCAFAGGWDNATGSAILFGGVSAPPGQAEFAETWSFSQGTWTNVSPSLSPVAREFGAAAYDPSQSALFVFGGENSTDPALADSWAYRLATFPAPTAFPSSGSTDVGQVFVLSAPSAAVQPNASYQWLHLPGCAALDVPVLNCTAASAGTFAIALNVSAPNGTSGPTVPILYTVYSSPGVGTFSTFPPVVDAGQSVTFGASAAGGTGVYTFNWTALPAGCASTNSPSLSCVPTSVGSFRPHLTVTDSNGARETGVLPPLTVNGALGLNITVTPTPTFVAKPFAIVATVIGGTPPTAIAWSALPAGCHEPSSFVVNCTENAVGTVRVAVSIRDSSSEQLTRIINVSVVLPGGTRTNGTPAGSNPGFLNQYGLYLGLGAAAVLLLLLAVWQRARGQKPPSTPISEADWKRLPPGPVEEPRGPDAPP
ncbi:MAG: hypothetical protein L3K07_08700, partial [Thermoplasmata archaeon]|nr:hypothetical protein [Thermoplasmata archaeon]